MKKAYVKPVFAEIGATNPPGSSACQFVVSNWGGASCVLPTDLLGGLGNVFAEGNSDCLFQDGIDVCYFAAANPVDVVVFGS